jgi:hypothetical protein
MKRQLRPILAAIALLSAPLAWSQSSASDSAPGASSDAQQASPSDPSQGGAADSSSSSSSSSSQASAPNPYRGIATYSNPYDSDSTNPQNGSSDQNQSGIPGVDDGSQSGLGGPQATFSHPEKLPPLNLFSEATSHTGLGFNFGVGEIAQYTGGYANQPSYWSALSLVNAGVSIVQARPTMLWSLSYGGGITNTAATIYNTYSNLNQNANFHFIWSISKRWQFRMKDSFLYSDDPFQPFLTYLGQPTPNNPNPVIYFPQTIVEQNQATAELTYRLAAHDSINFYGGESFQHYLRGSQVDSNTSFGLGSLWNSTTYAGGAFYQHLFSPRLTAGAGYIFTALDFGHGQSRAGVQMIQLNATYTFSRRLTVSGWVGPQFTSTKDLVPLLCFPTGCLIEVQHHSYINAAEGANVTWQATPSNSFGVQFIHSITNGGGLFGAVHFTQVAATFSRPLNHVWNFAAGGLYAKSDSVTPINGDQYLHGLQSTVNFSRRIKEAWTMNAYYAFIHQTQNYYGVFGVPVTLTTSGLGITVQYNWNHSLGR